MGIFDWLIVILPVIGILCMGMYSRKYIRGVADYLSAGRVCGRYVISVGDIANALSIIGLAAYVEVHYRTGFAIAFWSRLTLPIGVILGLTGYCSYRFRETKAMSLGQFLEMRYSRSFRIFAAALRSLSEILANMIMPAIAARFFIYFLDLPRTFSLFGLQCPTFMIIVFIVLCIAISIICMGGTLALVITDAIQGMLMYPMLVVFVLFVLLKFSWTEDIVPVMSDRMEGESFLNPYDVENLRDFNLFFIVLTIFTTFLHRASWIGAGTSTAAKSPHEQKMAGLLGTWRSALGLVFYLLIAVVILVFMNHKKFANEAKEIRDALSNKIVVEIAGSKAMAARLNKNISAIRPQIHEIGKDAPLGEKKNLDTTYFNVVHKTLLQGDDITPEAKKAHIARVMKANPGMTEEKAKAVIDADVEKDANTRFQQFRTLYNQQMMASSMRKILPNGLIGLFCLLLVFAMISTDDTRIYSAALTITQDVVMPLRKTPFTPEQHVLAIRLVAIGVGVIFFFGSLFMAQLDYINLFVTIVTMMWMGGCGPVMIFGLYSRFGTTAGAWASLLSGMVLSLGSIAIQRNWPNFVYPLLKERGWVEPVGNFLETVSKPFNPYIVWKMDMVKCPINSYEFYFITMIITLTLYIVVSYATLKEPFNLDRMLHRGKYRLDGEEPPKTVWNFKTILTRIMGITPEFTRGDKVIAWAYLFYSIVYSFFGCFIMVLIWNAITPWPIEWWGHYFLIISLIVPGIVSFISMIWFGFGGAKDLIALFRALENRVVNHLDNGAVSGGMSLADKEALEAVDKKDSEK